MRLKTKNFAHSIHSLVVPSESMNQETTLSTKRGMRQERGCRVWATSCSAHELFNGRGLAVLVAVLDHGRRCDLFDGGIVMDLDADLSDILILGKWD